MTDPADRPNPLARVRALLDRETDITALTALSEAMRFELPERALAETAIAFDANVFLRLSGNPRCEDIVDYLRTRFEGKLILPGQVVQEFWNNEFSVVPSVAASVKKKLEELSTALGTIDDRYDEFSDKFAQLIEEFNTNFGYIFDDKTVRRTKLFVELLQERALVTYVPRTLLEPTAQTRKKSKTPPGFKDDLYGDFFVWADLLLALGQIQDAGFTIRRVILVTLDKKIDWSRAGVPHPILSAEIAAMCNAEFEILSVDHLARRLLD